MNKKTFLSLTILAVITMATVIGCDNRSQIEKDADKAASKIEGALK